MAEGKLTQGFTWRLSDPGMRLLERAGLAALYMSLRAAEEQGVESSLAPLTWNADDLTCDSVTIHSDGTDKEALTKLFEWAWQVRDRVLYLPGIHRSAKVKDNAFLRVPLHNGIFETFLQHNKHQAPRGQKCTDHDLTEPVDELHVMRFTFREPPNGWLKPIHDLAEATDSKGRLKLGYSLANWVMPGSSPRYGKEVSWRGPAELGILLMLAPISCLYHVIEPKSRTWAVVVPDIRHLEAYEEIRLDPQLGITFEQLAAPSLGDAAMRFLSRCGTDRLRRELVAGCRVIAVGRTKYFHNILKTRKGVVDVGYQERPVAQYRVLNRILGNRWVKRKPKRDEPLAQSKGKRNAKKDLDDAGPQATHFVAIPTGRGRIADNLIAGLPWYADLAEPLPWDREALDRLRKQRPGKSIKRLWFQNLCCQRGKLMDVIQEEEMWDDPDERLFVEACWEILGLLYIRERKAVERGGSRTYEERRDDLNEDIRRMLTRSKTGPLLRQTMADLMTRPFEMCRSDPEDFVPTRSKSIRSHPAVIWRLIDGDWKRGRDLALLALASYQTKEKRGSVASDEPESIETTV